jgi:hypothetical protein
MCVAPRSELVLLEFIGGIAPAKKLKLPDSVQLRLAALDLS